MSTPLPKVRLGEVVTDLTASRTFDINAEQEVVDPTIKSATHTMSVGGRSVGAGVRVTKRIQLTFGDLVFSRLHTQNGAFAFADQEYQATGTFVPLSISETKVDRRFLFWALHICVPSLSASDTVGRETYKTSEILNLEIPLPALAEQRRIVARIEDLVAQISEAKALRKQAAAEAEALWTLSASKIFDRLAESHPVRSLGDIVTISGGGTPSKSVPFYWEGRIPWITPKDMKHRELSDAIDHISERATQETAAKLIQPGAVLVVVRGMILAHTFPSAVLRASAAINQDMKALVPKKELLPEFLCAFFWASNSRMLELVEKSTHDTRKFETEKLLGTNVVVPPILEQHQVIAELDALRAEVDKLKRLQAETAAELDALLPSILDKAFKGEL